MKILKKKYLEKKNIKKSLLQKKKKLILYC